MTVGHLPGSLRAAVILLSLAAVAAGGQRFDRGQNVAPVFEGWERNADGTFTMVFGYMNRNHEEIPQIAVGPTNFFEPGPADRGQPSRFYPRRQQFVFRVQVPADWGDKDLVWTLTHQGRTDKAYGSLWPSWEIDDGVLRANRGMGLKGSVSDNQPPSVALTGGLERTVTLPNTLTLATMVGDDGIPGPRPPRPESSDPRAAALRQAARRRPSPNNQAVVDARVAAKTGLAVTWTVYRGNGAVRFEPQSVSVSGGLGGEAVTTVSFSQPGDYVLRAYADDSILTTPIDVAVTVAPPTSGPPPSRR